MASTEDIDSADDVYVEKVTGGFRLYFKNGSSKNYLNAEVSGTHVNLVSKTTATTVWTYDSANKCIKTTVTVSGSNVEYYIGTYGTYNTFSTSAIKHVSNSYPAYLATKNNGGGTVTPPVTDSVTLDKTSLTLNVGDTATLVATATGTVTWTTSDNSVVTVCKRQTDGSRRRHGNGNRNLWHGKSHLHGNGNKSCSASNGRAVHCGSGRSFLRRQRNKQNSMLSKTLWKCTNNFPRT